VVEGNDEGKAGVDSRTEVASEARQLQQLKAAESTVSRGCLLLQALVKEHNTRSGWSQV
jgi:hypothetical protein